MNHKRLFIVPLILSFFLTGCLAPQVEDNTNTNNTNTQQNGNDNQNNGETNNNDTNGSETGNDSGNDNGTTGTGDDNGQDNTGGDNNQGNTGGNSGNTNEGDQNGTGNNSGNTGNENTGENNNQGGTGNESGNNGGDTGNAGGDSGNTGTGGDSDNTNTGGDSGNTNTSGDTGTNVATEGDGTEAHPYTISQAYDIIDALQEGKNNGKVVYVTGTVTTSVEDIYHGKYGSSFYITDGTKTIYAYSIAGVSKTEGNSKYVADGYTVVVSGALIKYNATKYEVGYASDSLKSNLVSSTPGTSSGSSSGGSSGSGTSTQTPKEKATWTIMIYMCGSTLESDSKQGGYATDDIKEILSVSNQPDDVNIIIETGGASKWYGNLGIKANELGRWHVENKKLVKDASLTKANMGLQSTFESFLTWGLTYYPADRVGVIMWNHGGALDGCCFDENYDDNPLTNAEVNAALTNVKQSLNRTENFEFIAYDACLMAVQDIAEFNSHHFNYMLCSQESESGYGYDYDKWVDDLYANPTTITTEALLTEAGQTFLDEEKALYQEWNEPFDQTQSVYDLSKMAVYKTAYEAVATELAKTIDTKDKWNSFVTANIDTNNVQKYGADENGNYLYDIFDAEDVLNNIKNSYSSLSTKVDAAVAALEAVVVWEAHGEATSGCGMNIYCPINYKYYEEDTNFANWYSLCKLSGLYKDN